MTNQDALGKLLWSIALPGFGQLLNRKYLKGFLFVALEFLVNTKANLNDIIMLSFQGETLTAVRQADYHWLMFYPCLYMFSVWDAFRDGGGGKAPFSYLPFVCAAFFGTVGIIYSPLLHINGLLLGPVWLPLGLAFIGIFAGIALKVLLLIWFSADKPPLQTQ